MREAEYLILIICVHSTLSDFLGGTFWWTPVNKYETGFISVSFQLAWSNPSQCPGKNRLVGQPGWIQTTGPIKTIGSSLTPCHNQGNENHPFSAGTKTMNHVPVVLPKMNLNYSDGSWLIDIASEEKNWKFNLLIMAALRPDNGQVNSSPKVGFFPIFSVTTHCPLADGNPWPLPVFDEDGDLIRCRFADDCGGLCDSLQHTRNHFKNLELRSELGCSLVVNGNSTGKFGIGLQFEDYTEFLPHEFISNTPLQFIITVSDSDLTDCTLKPYFTRSSLQHMSCPGSVTSSEFKTRFYISSGRDFTAKYLNLQLFFDFLIIIFLKIVFQRYLRFYCSS